MAAGLDARSRGGRRRDRSDQPARRAAVSTGNGAWSRTGQPGEQEQPLGAVGQLRGAAHHRASARAALDEGRYSRALVTADVREVLAVRLCVDGRPIGTLAVANRMGDRFTGVCAGAVVLASQVSSRRAVQHRSGKTSCGRRRLSGSTRQRATRARRRVVDSPQVQPSTRRPAHRERPSEALLLDLSRFEMKQNHGPPGRRRPVAPGA